MHPVFLTAAEGGATTAMESITSAVDTVVTFVTKAFTAMTGNAYLTIFLAATMLSVGISVFRKLRKGC